MKPEAQKYIKLLKFDPAHPSSKLPLTVYSYSTVNASSYPNLLKESFTTISVGAFLVTYDFNLEFTSESSDPVCAIAVPEFCNAAGEGPSQMARSQPEFAGARAGLDLLSAHDERNPRLPRQDRYESSGETRKAMLGGGANPGILQLNIGERLDSAKIRRWGAANCLPRPE